MKILITPLYKIHIISLERDKEKVCRIVLNSSKVHIETDQPQKGWDAVKNLEKKIQECENAIEILNTYSPPKKKSLFYQSSSDVVKAPVADSSEAVIFHNSETERYLKKISENEKRIQGLIPFKNFDLPLKQGETSYVKYCVLMLSGEVDKNFLEREFGDIYTEIIFSSPQKSAVFFILCRGNESTFLQDIKRTGFYSCEIISDLSPLKEIELLNKENEKLKEKISTHKSALKKLIGNRGGIKITSVRHKMKKEIQNLILSGEVTDNLFMLRGFVSVNDAPLLKKELETKCLCHVDFVVPDENDDVPVLFENNIFASPLEGITKTYALPAKQDIDPNFITAIFYYVFFGMMFSDAGYGLLVALVCGFLALRGRAEIKNTMTLFFFCGISTFFWGLLFGSFFGDSVNVISKTFLGKDYYLKPLWLDPAKEPLKLLIFSVCLGLAQILTGMAIRFYTLIRQKDYKGAFFDTASWIFILSGVALILAGTALKLPVTTPGAILSLTGAVTVILTKGREKRNPFARFFTGILGLYDITGLVSDVLSYSRLMALGLSTGVIASVVNMMASLSGNSLLGTVVFVAVFITGHGLNFAINMLGAYVHTNRLQYVEFFSKFYRGGGKSFKAAAFKSD